MVIKQHKHKPVLKRIRKPSQENSIHRYSRKSLSELGKSKGHKLGKNEFVIVLRKDGAWQYFSRMKDGKYYQVRGEEITAKGYSRTSLNAFGTVHDYLLGEKKFVIVTTGRGKNQRMCFLLREDGKYHLDITREINVSYKIMDIKHRPKN